MIDQIFQHGGVELLLAREVDQDTGIEIAAARAHDHSAGRRQAHAGVDGFAAFDGGHACAIAEMSDDQSVGRIGGKLVHDRFAREAVEPVALDALRPQFPGDRKDARDRRQSGVKRGVETRHLRKPGKMHFREADDRQSWWNMQRCEGRRRLKLPQDLIVNAAMLPELRPAMHNAMPDGRRRREFGIGKKSCDADDRFL